MRVDKMSMGVSLEGRVPFLDHKFVELALSIPSALKTKNGDLKYILKKTVGHVLPASIMQRKDKMGFPVPLHMWVKGRSREFFHDILLSERCRSRGLFDPAEVQKLLAKEPDARFQDARAFHDALHAG